MNNLQTLIKQLQELDKQGVTEIVAYDPGMEDCQEFSIGLSSDNVAIIRLDEYADYENLEYTLV